MADARDYELQRLGNRRLNNGIKITTNGAAINGVAGNVGKAPREHRTDRTHDRERSRSDHRIASYACEEAVVSMLQQQQRNVAAAAAAAAQTQQRREKTFKV